MRPSKERVDLAQTFVEACIDEMHNGSFVLIRGDKARIGCVGGIGVGYAIKGEG